MKQLFLFLFLFSFSLSSFANKTKWHKHYNLVLSDIKSVEKIPNRDMALRVRLFELYGEKLQLLLQRENEYRIRFLNTGKSKALNIVIKKQKETLVELEKIAKRIERLTDDNKVLAKINYYRSLNFSLVKKKDLFYKYIKKAEELNKDKQLGMQINLKLADHYYNEKMFSNAVVYYQKVVSGKKDQWATKNYYNLAWSYLKLEDFQKAIKAIKIAHNYEKRKGYFKIGEQLIDAILLFHAYAKKTKEGLAYLEREKIANFENLLKYIDFIYKSGEKKSLPIVINRVKKLKRSKEQEYLLTAVLVEIYRNIKKYVSLQRHIAEFRPVIRKKSKVSKEVNKDLINKLTAYTGFLQKVIGEGVVIPDSKQDKYLKYISFNFDTLKELDPNKSFEYMYYKGETHFKVQQFDKAILIYLRSLSKNISQNKKSKFLDKSFDSLFAAIEKSRKVKGSILVASFTTYLKYYPRSKKAAEVYKRLIAYYRSVGKDRAMFVTLRRYNRAYPNQQKDQREYYGLLIDKYIAKRDLNSISSLKKFVDKGFLGFGSKESLKLKKIMSEIYFSKYEGLAKKGKFVEAIKGFQLLFDDKKSNYELRVDSLRKKMFYQDKIYDYLNLGESLLVASNFFNVQMLKKHDEEIKFYTQNVCVGDEIDKCLRVYEAFTTKKILYPKELQSLYFKMKSSFEPLKLTKLPNRIERRNFLFKLYLADPKRTKNSLLKNFYQDKSRKALMDSEYQTRILQKFYKSLSYKETAEYIQKIDIPEIRKKHLAVLNNTFKILNNSSIALPKTPEVPTMTEETFGKLGGEVMQAAQNNSTMFEMVISKIDPNYLPYVLSQLILRLEKVTDEFKRFIPISKNVELEKAMNSEMESIHKYFDNQIVEYRNLYYRAVSATAIGSGARLYNEDIITKPKRVSLEKMSLWESY